MAGDALVFDLDGTVWDSHPWYQRALERCIGRAAEEIPSALLEGRSIVRVVEGYGVTRTSFVRALCETSEGALYPGILDAVQGIALKGVPMGVHTSLPSWIAKPLLLETGLSKYFDDAVRHAGNSRARKPNPAGLLSALAALGVDPSEQVYYVGDRDVDAETARRAGVRFAWAQYGYGGCRPGNTALILSHPGDLARL